MKFSTIKKILLCTPVAVIAPMLVASVAQTTQSTKTQNNKNVGILPGDKLSCENPKHKVIPQLTTNNQNPVRATMSLSPIGADNNRDHCSQMDNLDFINNTRGNDYCNWNRANAFTVSLDTNAGKLTLHSKDMDNRDRLAYREVDFNVTIPANTAKYDVSLYADVNEEWYCNGGWSGDAYHSRIQLFNIEDDIRPTKFTNLQRSSDVDRHTFFQHEWSYTDLSWASERRGATYRTPTINWTFSNPTNQEKTFKKSIGVSYWIKGEYGANGDEWGDLHTTFYTSVTDFSTTIQQQWGDIKLQVELDTKTQTCKLVPAFIYMEGKGTMVIPDHVTYCGHDFYVREIPDNWADGSNDIRGLEFAPDVTHLKRIGKNAFAGTNALDNYIIKNAESKDPKDFPILNFPEGLEVIEEKAFYGTSYKWGEFMAGIGFPSTLKEIQENAFFHYPVIQRLVDERPGYQPVKAGALFFASTKLPKIHKYAFGQGKRRLTLEENRIGRICAPTHKIAVEMRRILCHEDMDLLWVDLSTDVFAWDFKVKPHSW